YIGFSFDVTDLLASGGTYKLRFANVANDAALQLGVDNVSLNVTAVPEPESWALMLAGIGMVGAIARRRLA
uniref:PEPxxWA-CTERM sorting domain-containing protein n=2 Tax=Pseudomonadota TaxID=1224 RepID=UPI00254E9C49